MCNLDNQAWENKADFWDKLMGQEGNAFQQNLVSPGIIELLQPKKGEKALDLACGTGVTTRLLRKNGLTVTGLDRSQRMLYHARRRGPEDIKYVQADLTKDNWLDTLKNAHCDPNSKLGYKAIVCSMGFMDIAKLGPLLFGCNLLLKENLKGDQKKGRLVISLAHPCFNSGESSIEKSKDSHICHIKVTNYLDAFSYKDVGALGEPNCHTYYHRSLENLFFEFSKAGFVVNGLLEPEITEKAAFLLPIWGKVKKVPPVLILRLIPV